MSPILKRPDFHTIPWYHDQLSRSNREDSGLASVASVLDQISKSIITIAANGKLL